jgi:hypothetical protein
MKNLKIFLYEWTKNSAIFAFISSLYIFIIVNVLPFKPKQTPSILGLISHVDEKDNPASLLLLFCDNCWNDYAVPHCILLITNIGLNSLIFGIVIYVVNQIAALLSQHK